jgi:hypothetical protein
MPPFRAMVTRSATNRTVRALVAAALIAAAAVFGVTSCASTMVAPASAKSPDGSPLARAGTRTLLALYERRERG